MHQRVGLAFLALLTTLGCGGFAPSSPPPPTQDIAPTGQLPRDVTPLGYTLEMEIVPIRDHFSGRTQIRVRLDRPSSRIWLHGSGLRVKSARASFGSAGLDGSYFEVGGGIARLAFPRAIPAGEAVLELVYDASLSRKLTGIYKVETGGDAYAFSQFESIFARSAFPCFDEPGFKTPFDVWLSIPVDQTAISNAPEVSSEVLPGGLKRVHFMPTLPLPTYLVAFAVGPLDVVPAPPVPPNLVRPVPLALRGVAARGKGAQLTRALEHTPSLIAELERYLGLPFPFPKLDLIAVPDFEFGAMENAGAITFREFLLLVDSHAASEEQVRAFENVDAHEIAHHWFGDLVTMPWWNETWLNESFATWMAARVVAAVHPEQRAEVSQRAAVLRAMDLDSRVTARRVREPILSTHDIANAFDGITYQKGAGVLGMFERFVGQDVFRSGIQSYLRSHAGGHATFADLAAALSHAAGRDLSSSMSTFLDQPGVPWLDVAVTCPSESTVPAALTIRQERYLPVGSTGNRQQIWQIPMCARYQVRGQIHETCTVLEAAQATVPLQTPGCPDWVIPNADGAGYYRWALAPAAVEQLRRAGFPRLTTTEKQSFVDSVRAGFANGAVTAETALGILPTLAADQERVIATAPTSLLEFVRSYVLTEAERPALDRFAAEFLGARLDKLGWRERKDDDGDVKLLRAELVQFLALITRDQRVRAKAAHLGRVYLGLEGAAGDAEGVPSDLRNVAVQVAVQEGRAEVWDAVYQRLRATVDPAERDRMLMALVSVRDDRNARALALTFDPALHVNEVLTPIRIQMADERTRAAAWTYLEQNFDAIAGRLSAERAGSLPGLAVPFCSQEMADRLQTFFAPRIQQLMGGPRNLAIAVESLKLCAAQAALQRESAKAFFARAKR